MTKNILESFSPEQQLEFERILECLGNFDYEKIDLKEDIGIFNGFSGISLLLYYLYQYKENDHWADKAEYFFKKSYDNLSSDNFNLSHGTSGVMWLLYYLKSKEFIDDEFESVFLGYDKLLLKKVDDYMGDIDPMHGLLSIANYLFLRNTDMAIDCLKKILDRVENEKIIFNETMVYWEVKSNDLISGTITHINFGYAHGVLAILYFLSKYIKAGLNLDQAIPLFEQGINYFLSVQDEYNYMQFPNRIQEGNAKNTTRVAYCYGDLGLACGLTAIANNLSRPDLLAKARSLANNTASFSIKEIEKVDDVGLCHGAAGNGYMFLKLFNIHHDEILRDASVEQFKRLLALRNKNREEGVMGFSSIDYDYSKKEYYKKTDPGFITGTSGIGLAILGLLNDLEETDWDTILLLQ